MKLNKCPIMYNSSNKLLDISASHCNGVFYFQVFLHNFFTHILQVTLPQYQHLMAMEKKLMRLEAMMKKISDKSDPDTLQNNPKWNALIKMRDMLTKYVPRMPNPIEEWFAASKYVIDQQNSTFSFNCNPTIWNLVRLFTK